MRTNACHLLEAGSPDAPALVDRGRRFDYAALRDATARVAGALAARALGPRARVGVVVDKSFEAVAALFGILRAGLIAVPINPQLKAAQVAHIVRDCGLQALFIEPARWRSLARDGLRIEAAVILLADVEAGAGVSDALPSFQRLVAGADPLPVAPTVESDAAAILYTSGSTGLAKGVVLSHRNLIAGAESVASYLANDARDRILAVLPLSFDAGLSQLTTAFSVGATAVLHEYLLPQACVRLIAAERITGLTAVPPLWMQLTRSAWPAGAGASLRYFANTGGHMPQPLLAALRACMPTAAPFLMYGLTEAFRSTYLPPEQAQHRPDSIGRAIPGAQILVLRPDGSPCDDGEPGELVHRGPTVALGYWNDPVRTAERFRPLPRRADGLTLDEIAVWSGDTVVKDADGYLYFVGRRDEMIKTSGYRVSPNEVEQALYGSGLVAECAVFGEPDEALGQAIVAVAWPAPDAAPDWIARAADTCRDRLPGWMVPRRIVAHDGPLPRNANGKIDRQALAATFGTAAPTAPSAASPVVPLATRELATRELAAQEKMS